MNRQSAAGAVRKIAILVFDGVKMLDVSGPAEVFTEANKVGGNYALSYVSVTRGPIRTSIGLSIPTDEVGSPTADYDTVVVAGGDHLPITPIDEDLVAATRLLNDRTRRLASICTGAFVLARSGLLDGKQATTHWEHTAKLARIYPSISVDPSAIFVKHGRTYTSAGVTAGIDLALALVEEDLGAAATRTVAQSLVVYMQRAGGQSQFSGNLQGPAPSTPLLRTVVDFVKANPTDTYTVQSLAHRVNVSARHLTRLFREELDTTPAKYIELMRFDLARASLDAGHAVSEAAQRAGFTSTDSFRRAFITRLGVLPSTYQHRFLNTSTKQR